MLLPKIELYKDPEFVSLLEPEMLLRAKREIVTALTLSVLLGLGTVGAGTGIGALIHNTNQISRLSAEIDEDLKTLEVSISAMQESLTSLAEVALQNRRGLDLLFLKQGGLCAALGEDCCFYADSSGVVTDSLNKLRERLKNREIERQQSMGWFQSMFQISPWLTTLLSALIGPLILLILLCTIGPCMLSKILNFLRNRLYSMNEVITDTHTKINSLTCNMEKQALLQFSDSDYEEPDIMKEDMISLMDMGSDGSEDVPLAISKNNIINK